MRVSIVVPVYRSAECLPELVQRVAKDLAHRFDGLELILVNDDSPDASWDVIVGLTAAHEFLVGVNLRRNVGQDNAIMAGLRHATGDVVVIMDDDLQHDPLDVPRLCEEIERGHDVVYARFESKRQALWKNLGSWFNDRVAVMLLRKPVDLYMSPFKAVRRGVVDEIVRYEGPFSYVDGIILSITSNLAQIPAAHSARFAGSSNYDLVRSIRVWLKLATSFSVIPLRVASFAGMVVAVLAFGLGAYFIVETLRNDRPVEGWASTIVSVFFLGGVQLLTIGVLGEYVGRAYLTLYRRPQFAVKEVVGRSRAVVAEHR